MASLEQFLSAEGKEKFQEAVKLNDVESQNDPETDPFKSKYKAREIWHELKCKLEDLIQEGPPNDLHAKVTLAVVVLKLGTNYAETEETSTGEEHFANVVKSLEEYRLNGVACNVLQHALNQMGILWASRRKFDTALEYLQRSEQLFKDFKREVGSAAYTLEEFFDIREETDEGAITHKREENFEDTYTHTLYYLAQVYAKLEDIKRSSKYCHVTLSRQLETKKYTALDWALNAATLSQYYVTKNDFALARHCLASASVILTEVGEPVTKVEYIPEETEAQASERERLPRTWSDLYRCWAKYGMALLETSWERALEAVDQMDEEETDDHNSDKKKADDGASVTEANQQEADEEGACNDATNAESKDGCKLYFDLELTSVEGQITDKFVKDFGQARAVFLMVQKWLNAAKEFYVLDGQCTDHVEIVQDHSRLFKLLAYFEMDFDRQGRMHKRRADMLEALLKELSPQHYLLICRQLMYELAETYSAILDVKLAIIEEAGNPPTPHAMNKINILAKQSIDKYTDYINSLKNTDSKLPDKFGEDDERPALVAYFCMGRLYSKFLDFEVTKRLANLKQSIDHYGFIVDYCKRNPSALPKIQTERDICQEMITLLPAKMEKIRAQADN